ncbi:hypothetical protein ABID30_001728 [Enterococcus rotai]|nr:hypothetical protein [Enterococcus rotai]
MESYGKEYPSCEICSCCGFQFGIDDDKGISHDLWRETWIKKDCSFWYTPDRPIAWDVEKQLKSIGIMYKKKDANKNICPVCKYDGLDEPAYNSLGYGSYDICQGCGFQFGLDDYPDKNKGIQKWRENWIRGGSSWYSTSSIKPNWNPTEQLIHLSKIKK